MPISCGGPHAGTYEPARGRCHALNGQAISMFTPELAGVRAEGSREHRGVYGAGKGRPDGFAMKVDFRARSGEPWRDDGGREDGGEGDVWGGRGE